MRLLTMMSPSLFFSWLLPFLFPALVSTHPTATGSPATGQNLTSYLLTTHATIYQQAISAPAFFAQVRNGTVEPGRVAFFFEQDVLYGRGFTALTGTALSLVVANETVELASPQENLTLSVVDGWGQTASGLSDEGGRLIEARAGILGGLSQQQQAMAEVSCPSQGTREYVQFMQGVSYWGKRDGFAGLVCAWVMGKVSLPCCSRRFARRCLTHEGRLSSISGRGSRPSKSTNPTRSRSYKT